MSFRRLVIVLLFIGLGWSVKLSGAESESGAQNADPYEAYIKTSKDFQTVKQDKDWEYDAWPSWLYIPWYYQWTIGWDDAAGKFCQEYGYNGAFLNNGQTQRNGVDLLAWINRYQLRFYMGHTASKGYLYIRKKRFKKEIKRGDFAKTGLRFVPLNTATIDKMKSIIRGNINRVKSSPYRAAYALDDETSWGTFVKPCMWRLIDDSSVYSNWLKEVYGEKNAPNYGEKWISYEDVRKKLATERLKDFDFGELMDQWTFNDAYWTNMLGDLVGYANQIDPHTPVGIVGGQSPNAFGGYDYARLMRKIQFLEAYNIGGSQTIIRSFNPHNALPTVTTHFHKAVKDTIWQTWYYLAQGNRGFIGWVEGWFNGKTPKPFIKKVAGAYLEAGKKIGPLMSKAEWIHDGVAIYYNHPSIQMSWILDAEPHGSTWPNRNGDSRLGTSHLCRKAWENMLRDEGIQYTYVNYVDLIQNNDALKDYKVLILPATYCLSDAEARRIRAFCQNGGTVIADFLPGVFDQHGRAHKTGAVLDDMFGVKHDMNMTKADIFQTKLWVETNQEANFSYKTYDELIGKNSDCITDASGFNKAVRSMGVNHVSSFGKGTAVLMNLSPQWYNAYRLRNAIAAAKRSVFMDHVKAAGVTPWVRIENAPDNVFGYEITYWSKGDRTILFLVYNPEIKVTSLGGGNSAGLRDDTVDVALAFTHDMKNVRNERTGKALPDGNRFMVSWKMNEAVVLSFERPAAQAPAGTVSKPNPETVTPVTAVQSPMPASQLTPAATPGLMPAPGVKPSAPATNTPKSGQEHPSPVILYVAIGIIVLIACLMILKSAMKKPAKRSRRSSKSQTK